MKNCLADARRGRFARAVRLVAIASALLASASHAGPAALDVPDPATVKEARDIVQQMKRAPRGPYKHLRWFCNDGTVLPPRAYACREHGGGRQHAQYSEARQRLAGLGWHVGTVFTAMPWEEFWNPGARNQRMRELPLEQYLVAVDDGWVLRKARFYRGRVQVEDEEDVGHGLLLRLLAERDWVARHFLLTREIVRVVPHHGGGDRTREIRRVAQEIAEEDRTFENLRIQIHSAPEPESAAAVRAWADAARQREVPQTLLDEAERLAVDLDMLYGAEGRAARLERAVTQLSGNDAFSDLAGRLREVAGLSGTARVERLAGAMSTLRELVTTRVTPAEALMLLDLMLDLEADLNVVAFEVLGEGRMSRRQLLGLARGLLDGAYGSGLLSAGERNALLQPLGALLRDPIASTDDYLWASRVLNLAAGWAIGSVRHAFAEPLTRYVVLEPESARFIDEVLRSSPMLPLAEAARLLVTDAQALSGITLEVFGEPAGGMLALNPGVAVGRLRVVTEDALRRGVTLDPGDVVVLPETVSDLTPVAGILTLGEGNLLSHVQMLARNLAIPNVVVDPSFADRLRAHDGERVLLAATVDGSIVLEREAALAPAVRDMLRSEAPEQAAVSEARLSVPPPALDVHRPLTLAEMSPEMAGEVVGPKAANVAGLAALFPGRVAPGVALPFGVFADHLGQGEGSVRAALEGAYRAHRKGALDDRGLERALEDVRAATARVELSAATREELVALMRREFGPEGSYGVFVRSDTNVEDLPGFTGAGLNMTVPHVVGEARILDTIPTVWSSVFSARSVAWRSGILERPEDVYSSVLIMKSVPADKSGVLVTTDLMGVGPGITVSTAWGVGGAVDGETAETLVLQPDGGVALMSESKAPYRRRLGDAGGVEWIPADSGPVLTASERQALRALAREVEARYPPAPGPDGEPLPWDVEFGFVGGEAVLFQIRPLVERGGSVAEQVVSVAARARQAGVPRVDLTATVGQAAP